MLGTQVESGIDSQADHQYPSGASTQRAWQALPRHLRRRAASHDVRRVPAKLRGKAKAEASNAVEWVIYFSFTIGSL